MHEGGRFEIISNVCGDATFDGRPGSKRLISFRGDAGWVTYGGPHALTHGCPHLFSRLTSRRIDDLISRSFVHVAAR